MSETDARLSFERHATSKIREASDLFALRTMGFRGEALASIAAVAQVELKTRPESEELGTKLVIAGSTVECQEAVSCSKGSNFSIKNLFFNVPARRKFLKANSTELSNILAEFERIALVHPEVAFSLYSNDSELFNLPVSPLRQRIMAIFGKKLNQQLLNIEVNTTMVKISGYVAKPETARKKGAHQYFFVNGRYMRHPYFHKAVMEAYEQLIPAGEQISYFIYFEVDPANIDVNIHPTKQKSSLRMNRLSGRFFRLLSKNHWVSSALFLLLILIRKTCPIFRHLSRAPLPNLLKFIIIQIIIRSRFRLEAVVAVHIVAPKWNGKIYTGD